MGYEFHIRFAAKELNNLAELARRFLSENGPGRPPDPVVLREQATYTGTPPAIAEALCAVAALVAADPALTALYSGLLDQARLMEYHEQTGGVMQALALFGALPGAVARHQALGVPDAITRDTFFDLNIALEGYASQHDGAFGIDHYKWLHNHFGIRLFQVGRLQYIPRPYTGYARVFVDDATGKVVLTAQAGVVFRGDGLRDFEGSSPKQTKLPVCESHWISESTEDDGFVRTNCLLVNGRAIQTPVVLDRSVWRLALEKDMYSLNMHIPRGRPLVHAECVDSLRRAWHFFRKLYPDRHFETYDCGSWLLETDLQNFLPPSSGIVRFLQLYRRYPLTASSWSFIDRGFGADPTAVEEIADFARTADRSTSLRRGLADYWLAGGRVSSAGGIIHQYDMIRMEP